MGICLIGTAGSRREEYFRKAAGECQADVIFIDWQEAADADLRGQTVKIDPPSYCTSDLSGLGAQVASYRSQLHRLARQDCRFFNTPAAIESVLDKYHCKKVLEEHGIATTEMLAGNVDTVEEVQDAMDRSRVFSVFIKPVFSSGAAGVVAYRREPAEGRELAYTSCCLQDGELVNTKKLFRLEKKAEIRQLLEAVVRLGVVVERWHPKAVHNGKSYDLRVVWQFGRMEFVVARQSRGPITNLHLNNAPLDWRELGLSGQTTGEIEQLCRGAVALFPGLMMTGIDILLEKKTLRPRIIEMNGQGDLMYQDIFYENIIYKRQIEELRRL